MRSLQTKIFVFTVLILLIGSGVFLYSTYSLSYQVVVEEVGFNQATKVVMIKHFMEKWFDSATDAITAWSSIPVFVDAVTQTGPYGARAVEESRRQLFEFVSKSSKFSSVYIYNLDGQLVASSFFNKFAEGKRKNVSDCTYFKVAASGKTHISQIIKTDYIGEKGFIFAVPIKVDTTVVGVMSAVVSIDFFSSLFEELGALRTKINIFLLDSNNIPIVSLLQTDIDEDKLKNDELENIILFLKENSFLTKLEKENQKPFLKDEKNMYIVSHFNKNDWKIVEVYPLSNVNVAIKKILNYNSIVVASIFFWVMLALFKIFHKYIYSRLYSLRKNIQLLEQGKLSARIKDDKGQDEITSLMDSFNKMAVNLQESMESLQKSQEQYRLAIEGSNDGIWDWDAKQDSFYFSSKWYTMLGYQSDNLGQMDYMIFLGMVYEDDKEKVNLCRLDILQGKIINKFALEFRMYHKSGELRWIRSRAIILRDDTGKVYRIVGANTDITQERLVAEQLVKAKEEAEIASHYKSEFLANMSHEIRTPIGFITGLCYMMKDTGMNEKQADYVHKIKKSAQNLLSIVNDILDFSKIEAGRLEIDLQTVNLHEIIMSVIESFQSVVQEKNIKLKCCISPEVPVFVESDSLRLNQIFVNLINNAIKFTSEGEVVLEAKCISKIENNAEVEIVVRDTGIGMSEKQQAKLFKAFSQADASVSRQFGGTGLGLVICRDLLKLLGGTISVRSEEGKGTEFVIKMNLRCVDMSDREEGDVAVTKQAKEEFDENKLEAFPDAKVLLAEDSPINVMIAQSLLAKLQIVPDVAQNGEEALQKVQTNDYDLILMDVQMPVMDGYTATEKIRMLDGEKYKTVPIIAMTANAMKQDIEKALAVGMNDHLSKPIELRLFYVLIQRYLTH